MPNAQCEIVTLQSMDYEANSFSNRKAYVERDAKMSWSLALSDHNCLDIKWIALCRGPAL